MMKESKLTNFQQRNLNTAMKDGAALPPACNPSSSAKRIATGPPTKDENSLVIDPIKYNPTVRTQEKIEATGAYDRDKFAPSPLTKYGGFYEKDKVRLADMMAYGEDLEPKPNKKPIRRKRDEVVRLDRFEELEKEIADRQAFLKDMESHGQGEKYRTIIGTEISQLIREMEIIDKQRSAELSKMIALEEKQRENKSGIPQP